MATIHVVLDDERATDRAARRRKQSRSALIRDALRDYLRRSLEERDRQGYRAHPPAELQAWQRVATWPDE
jgi:metal-responsive CopG/Arc/MetJ family transcriptional regulator